MNLTSKESNILEEFNVKRQNIMNSVNPCYILRNYVLQNAIAMAEKG